ncbi:hypothetical protein PVAP13_3NG258122 [Panicum virgatum]|uniref:Uncharacterized protein n=1 Tax=Panicum virgatum TaxID=38727 RepID=A0A8T0U6U6_PANVG|nr:hypothetical protein PVAP13_3NG258122 [Panicum virgatum]
MMRLARPGRTGPAASAPDARFQQAPPAHSTGRLERNSGGATAASADDDRISPYRLPNGQNARPGRGGMLDRLAARGDFTCGGVRTHARAGHTARVFRLPGSGKAAAAALAHALAVASAICQCSRVLLEYANGKKKKCSARPAVTYTHVH